jgi:hypothetical protein
MTGLKHQGLIPYISRNHLFTACPPQSTSWYHCITSELYLLCYRFTASISICSPKPSSHWKWNFLMHTDTHTVSLTFICKIIFTWLHHKIWNIQVFDLTSDNKKKLHGLSPGANYTDRVTAACRRSHCQLLRIEGSMWLVSQIPTAVFSVF